MYDIVQGSEICTHTIEHVMLKCYLVNVLFAVYSKTGKHLKYILSFINVHIFAGVVCFSYNLSCFMWTIYELARLPVYSLPFMFSLMSDLSCGLALNLKKCPHAWHVAANTPLSRLSFTGEWLKIYSTVKLHAIRIRPNVVPMIFFNFGGGLVREWWLKDKVN